MKHILTLIAAVTLGLIACGGDGISPQGACCSGGAENCSQTSIPWCCKSDEDCSAPEPTGGPVCSDGICSPGN